MKSTTVAPTTQAASTSTRCAGRAVRLPTGLTPVETTPCTSWGVGVAWILHVTSTRACWTRQVVPQRWTAAVGETGVMPSPISSSQMSQQLYTSVSLQSLFFSPPSPIRPLTFSLSVLTFDLFSPHSDL